MIDSNKNSLKQSLLKINKEESLKERLAMSIINSPFSYGSNPGKRMLYCRNFCFQNQEKRMQKRNSLECNLQHLTEENMD